MDKLKTMTDFSGDGVMPLISAIVTAVPIFFPVMLFAILIFGTGASYFAILTLTGKKRFWHSLTAISTTTFFASLFIVAMNTDIIIYLRAYWVGFYLMVVLVAYFGLSNYK